MDIICDGPKVAIKVIWHHTRVTHVVHGHEVHVQGSVGEEEDGRKQYYVHSKCKISELSLIKGEANNCLVFMDTLLSVKIGRAKYRDMLRKHHQVKLQSVQVDHLW